MKSLFTLSRTRDVFQLSANELLPFGGESVASGVCLFDFGGPKIKIADAVIAGRPHVFTRKALKEDALVGDGQHSARPLNGFGWRCLPDTEARTVLLRRPLFEVAPQIIGMPPEGAIFVLSVPDWDAAVELIRKEGLATAVVGLMIVTAEPMAADVNDRLEEALPRHRLRTLRTGSTWATFDLTARSGISGELLFGGISPEDYEPVFSDVRIESGILSASLSTSKALPDKMSVAVTREGEAIAVAQPQSRDNTGRHFYCMAELPRETFFDPATQELGLSLSMVLAAPATAHVRLPEQRFLNANELLDFDPDHRPQNGMRKPFGIIVYSHTRTESVLQVMESLKRQGALPHVELWMDGDQGKPGVKVKLEEAEKLLLDFGVPVVRRHRGNMGFRKLVLHSLFYMVTTYERFIVLEDDCFPTENAVAHFCKALDAHADDPDALTVYGSHFLMPAETDRCTRFQGWGWGTWSDRILPFLNELAYLYSLPEHSYLDWVNSVLTPEIIERIDCTAPRSATHTLTKFFAWDETLCLLAALRGKVHIPTPTRCIYNFGAGSDSTHFTNIDWYRNPPFNMILRDEVWEHFHEPTDT